MPKRDESGYPIPETGPPPPVMSPEAQHRYRMFLIGIRDPETVAELWRAKQAKRAAKRGGKKWQA